MNRSRDVVLVLAMIVVVALFSSHRKVSKEKEEWKAKTAQAYHILDRTLDKPAPVGEIEPQFIVDQADRVSDHLGYLKLELTTIRAKYDNLLRDHEKISTELSMKQWFCINFNEGCKKWRHDG